VTDTNTGIFDLFGLPPTGRPVTMTGQEIFRAHDGKLTKVWHQEDAPGMLRQLALTAPRLFQQRAPDAVLAASGRRVGGQAPGLFHPDGPGWQGSRGRPRTRTPYRPVWR